MAAKGLSRSIFGVAGVLLLSRLLGFFREVVVADKFGTIAEYDTYLIAIMFSALAYGILNYASYYLFVPYLTRKLQGTSSSDGPTDIWPLLNASLMVTLAVLVVLVLAAPYLLRYWAVDFVAEQFDMVVLYSRVTAITVLLGTGEAFMRAFLNVKRIYTYPAAGYIIYNVFAIAAIFFLSNELGVGALALAWVGGLLVQNIYLGARLMQVHSFGDYNPQVFTAETKYLISTATALILIEMVNRSYFLIDRYFAPQFGEGVVSALNYSQVLVQLPDSIIGFAIGAVVFPIFSAQAAPGNRDAFVSLYRSTIGAALLIAVPIAAVLYVSAPDIIYLLFQRGRFDPQSTAITATVLRPHLPALVALFIMSTSIRACYSGGWIRAVFWGTILLFVVKVLATGLLAHFFGYGGISAGTSVAQVGFALVLMVTVTLRTRVPGAGSFFGRLGFTVLAGIGAATLAFVLKDMLPESAAGMGRVIALVRVAGLSAAVLVLYVLLLYGLGMKPYIRRMIQQRFSEPGDAA